MILQYGKDLEGPGKTHRSEMLNREREGRHRMQERRGCYLKGLCFQSWAASADCKMEVSSVRGKGTHTDGPGTPHTLV